MNKLNESIKQDITLSLRVWQSLLNEFMPNGIEYIFTKGSSAKKWESDIDYVPIISDVDIHIKLKNNKKNFLSKNNSFENASWFTNSYEKSFYKTCEEVNHNPLHVPRVQIVQLDFHGRKGYVVPPREKDVKWIQGKTIFPEEFDQKKIREMDSKAILNEKAFIDTIPETYLELSGLEYYTLMYRINSRMSASPIRLLNQILNENPHDTWAKNKTSIKNILIENNFSELATHYENYYINGWKLFESSFSDTSIFRTMIKDGYYLLQGCYEEIKKII